MSFWKRDIGEMLRCPVMQSCWAGIMKHPIPRRGKVLWLDPDSLLWPELLRPLFPWPWSHSLGGSSTGPHQKELLSVSKPWEMHSFHSMLLTSTGLAVQGFFKWSISATIRGFLRPGLCFVPFQGPVTKTRVLFSIRPKTPFFTSSVPRHLFQINGCFLEAYETTGLGLGSGRAQKVTRQSELRFGEQTLHPTLKFSWAFDAPSLF